MISREEILLDTGGGVRRALPRLGNAPFFVVNGDALWGDGEVPALDRLASAWDDDSMDVLLLVVARSAAVGYEGPGDYDLDSEGRLRSGTSHVFCGVQMLHPRIFRTTSDAPFSLRQLYDAAEAAGRLHGVAHDAGWYHVGTPSALLETERILGGTR